MSEAINETREQRDQPTSKDQDTAKDTVTTTGKASIKGDEDLLAQIQWEREKLQREAKEDAEALKEKFKPIEWQREKLQREAAEALKEKIKPTEVPPGNDTPPNEIGDVGRSAMQGAPTISDEARVKLHDIERLSPEERADAVAKLAETDPKLSDEWRRWGGILRDGKGITVEEQKGKWVNINYKSDSDVNSKDAS